MGMSIVAVGFTHDTRNKTPLSVITEALREVPDSVLTDEEFINTIDPSGRWDGENIGADDIRDTLLGGAIEYNNALAGHRSTAGWPIPGTSLEFSFVGGESWGDDPFEGFDELCMFLDAVRPLGLPVEKTGLVCNGLPDPETAGRYKS